MSKQIWGNRVRFHSIHFVPTFVAERKIDRLVQRQPAIVHVTEFESFQPYAKHPWLPSERNLDPLVLVDSVPLKPPYPSFRTVAIEAL